MAIEHGKRAGQARDDAPPTIGVLGDAIAQLESSWGTPQQEWNAGDWQRAALALNRALALAGELIEKQGDVIANALRALAPTESKRRGRPPSKPKRSQGGLVKVKVTQPVSQRHLSSKQKAKRSTDDLFFLVAAVEAMKIKLGRSGNKPTDAEALFYLFKQEGVRQGKTRQSVKTRLAPMLSKARRQLKANEIADLDEKVKAAIEGLLKGALK